MTLLQVTALHADAGERRLLHGIDLAVEPGEVLAVLGDSGAGKSTLGLALLGEAAPGLRLGGRVRLGGTELLGLADLARRRARAGRIGYLPQHPGAVLDPVRRVGRVLGELAGLVHRDRRAAVGEACAAARFDPRLLRRFPHQLSGGQQQRAALAQTLVTNPAVLVLDEPTTGLDPGTSAELVDGLAALCAGGTAVVLLTHDHAVARALGGSAVVLDEGQVVRRGTVAEILGRADPAASGGRAGPPGRPRLQVRGAAVDDAAGRPVLRGVDVDAAVGELVAVVGPSGAGKTTFGRLVAGLLHGDVRGSVRVDGEPLPAGIGRRSAAQRGAVQYVHQDPRATFRPHRPVLDQVARPAVLLRGEPAGRASARAAELLDRLGVDAAVAARRPGTLSGGQLQRAAVARALAARPAVLICDEVTSALDATHRDGLLDAIDGLRRAHGTTVLLISHDHVLVDRVADRVLTVEDGRLVRRP
ncbi:ABC transporter ATP-binding protein [Pseudonocardia sp. DLS-67]